MEWIRVYFFFKFNKYIIVIVVHLEQEWRNGWSRLYYQQVYTLCKQIANRDRPTTTTFKYRKEKAKKELNEYTKLTQQSTVCGEIFYLNFSSW